MAWQKGGQFRSMGILLNTHFVLLKLFVCHSLPLSLLQHAVLSIRNLSYTPFPSPPELTKQGESELTETGQEAQCLLGFATGPLCVSSSYWLSICIGLLTENKWVSDSCACSGDYFPPCPALI